MMMKLLVEMVYIWQWYDGVNWLNDDLQLNDACELMYAYIF